MQRVLPSAPMSRKVLPSLLALALAACASAPTPVAPPVAPATPPAAAPVTPSQPDVAHVRDFSRARAEFVASTAQRFGIPAGEIEAVLAKAQIRETILKAMSRPAEAKPWRDYRPIFIQQKRIDAGRVFLAANQAALLRAEARYGVSKEVVVAILGVETSYGGNKGGHAVVDALYTLAIAYPRSG